MALVNMKQSREEAQEGNAIAEPDAPLYPYGLELRLDEEALAKLGFSGPPAVGSVMRIVANVTVTSASQYQTQDKEPEASSCWQITDLGVESSAKDSAQVAKTLYDKS